MTVAENMGFALKISGVNKSEIAKRVQEAAKILDLELYLERKPKALSGGQRQRVAMGRAIVRNPQVFLMDEPLSNLDAKLRVQTRTQIASLQKRLGVTTVYVTHDQTEAMTMGDRVVVMKDGFLQQADTPQNLYDNPANAFVAGFIGSPAMNLVDLKIEEGGARLGSTLIPIERSILSQVTAEGSDSITVGFRPEDLSMSPEGFELNIELVELLGADAYLYGQVADAKGEERQVTVRTDGRATPQRGTTIHLVPDLNSIHLFSSKTGDRFDA